MIGNLRSYEVKNTRYERPVVLSAAPHTGGLDTGLILDEQSNERICYFNAAGTPFLQYVSNPAGFYSVPDPAAIELRNLDYALFLAQENLLVCTFRLCNFAKAKFAPRQAWSRLIAGLVTWLGGCCAPQDVEPYFHRVYQLCNDEHAPLDLCVRQAMAWF